MIDVTKGVSRRTHEADKTSTYDLLEFKDYNNFFPSPEDEVMGLEFLLAEPSCSDGLVEPFLAARPANLQHCFGNKEKQDVSIGTKNILHTLRRGEQCNWRDNSGHVMGNDEAILQEMNNLPSICEDYLFEYKLAGERSTLHCDSSKIPFINQPTEFLSENGKDYHDSKGKHGSRSIVDDSSIILDDLTAEAGRLCHSSACLFNKKVKPEVTSNEEDTFLGDSIVAFSPLVNDGSLLPTDTDACFSQKRSRKRPQRYIDEYSKYHPAHTNRRSGGPSKNTRESTSRTPYLDCRKDFSEKKLAYYNDYMLEPIQVPFGPSTVKKCSRRMPSFSPDYDSEISNKAIVIVSEESSGIELGLDPSLDAISDGYDLGEKTKDMSARKHNRYWSEYEIAKLIEGVATFGVGRWTEIKRGLFPSTTRRTSVDLKDKWRNLLKACRRHLHSSSEGRRIAHQQVSQSVLRQVKELAVMHPYPKMASRKNAPVVRF